MEKYKNVLEKIKECLKDGLLNKEIQTKLNIKTSSLSTTLKKNNLKRNKNMVTHKEINLIGGIE